MSIKGLTTAPGSNPEARWAFVRYARGIIGAAVDDSPIFTAASLLTCGKTRRPKQRLFGSAR
jgi:hypothetical protein